MLTTIFFFTSPVIDILIEFHRKKNSIFQNFVLLTSQFLLQLFKLVCEENFKIILNHKIYDVIVCEWKTNKFCCSQWLWHIEHCFEWCSPVVELWEHKLCALHSVSIFVCVSARYICCAEFGIFIYVSSNKCVYELCAAVNSCAAVINECPKERKGARQWQINRNDELFETEKNNSKNPFYPFLSFI